MKERPILFSAPMVRALLDGSKTQTRRICKAAKLHDDGEDYRDTDGWPLFDASADGCGDVRIASPYGQPGDRLWVRETWMLATPLLGIGLWPFYRATCHQMDRDAKGWKPSIHMRREHSRIDLEVTGVRVERLQDISEADAWAEGCARGQADDVGGFFPAEEPLPNGKGFRGWDNARDWYADLWEEINGDTGPGSWDANPWVWVVEFRRVRP